MKIHIEERTIQLAQYIIDKKTTVRDAAKRFGISKSTVHKDLTQRLVTLNPVLAGEARAILDENKSERHIRGGIATKNKYKKAALGK
ncbi:MAG: Stage III sporulation protein D [Firmicutes bacterium ADurb.Bin193]|nr:MAG: Stage III sporulation protein D [Firmicutes bacterium ADurb.Bin193]